MDDGEPDIPMKILIVGQCGDGKSTIINALRDPSRSEQADAGKAARGVTKKITGYAGKPIGGRSIHFLDSPGVGDMDVSPMKLVSELERELSGVRTEEQKSPTDMTRGGIRGVVVCTKHFDRVPLGAQVVKIIIEKGIVAGRGREHQWNNIVLVGTMADKADEDDLICFRNETVPTFFEEAPGKTGKYAIVHKDDYSKLLQELKGFADAQEITYTRPEAKDIAVPIAEKLGIDTGTACAALEYERLKWQALHKVGQIGLSYATRAVGYEAVKMGVTKMVSVTGAKFYKGVALVPDVAQAGLEISGHEGYGKVAGASGNAVIGGVLGFSVGGPAGAAAGVAMASGMWASTEAIGSVFDGGESWRRALPSFFGGASSSQPQVAKVPAPAGESAPPPQMDEPAVKPMHNDKLAPLMEGLKAQRLAIDESEVPTFEQVQAMTQAYEAAAKEFIAIGEETLAPFLLGKLSVFLEQPSISEVLSQRAANLVLQQANADRMQRMADRSATAPAEGEKTAGVTMPSMVSAPARSLPTAPASVPASGRTGTVTTLADLDLEGDDEVKSELQSLRTQVEEMNERLIQMNECQQKAVEAEVEQASKSGSEGGSMVRSIASSAGRTIGMIAVNAACSRVVDFALEHALDRIGVGRMSKLVGDISKTREAVEQMRDVAVETASLAQGAKDAATSAAGWSKVSAAASIANVVSDLFKLGGGIPQSLPQAHALHGAPSMGSKFDPNVVVKGAYTLNGKVV